MKRSPLKPAPKAPDHLSVDSQALWAELVGDYGLASDHAALAILRSALEAKDLAEEARQVLAVDGLTVEGDRGGTKAHPLCAVQRDARAAFLQGMKALCLSPDPPKDVAKGRAL